MFWSVRYNIILVQFEFVSYNNSFYQQSMQIERQSVCVWVCVCVSGCADVIEMICTIIVLVSMKLSDTFNLPLGWIKYCVFTHASSQSISSSCHRHVLWQKQRKWQKSWLSWQGIISVWMNRLVTRTKMLDYTVQDFACSSFSASNLWQNRSNYFFLFKWGKVTFNCINALGDMSCGCLLHLGLWMQFK